MAYQKTFDEQDNIAHSVALNNAVAIASALIARATSVPKAGQIAPAVVEMANTFYEFLKPKQTPSQGKPSGKSYGSGKPQQNSGSSSQGNRPSGSVKPNSQNLDSLDPETPQGALYEQLKDAFNGDIDTMERVMEEITLWRNKSISLKGIPNMTEARAGVAIKNLAKYLEEHQQGGGGDDDIPF